MVAGGGPFLDGLAGGGPGWRCWARTPCVLAVSRNASPPAKVTRGDFSAAAVQTLILHLAGCWVLVIWAMFVSRCGLPNACTFLFLIWAVGGVFFRSSLCGGLLWSRECRFHPAISICFSLCLESSRRCLLLGGRIRPCLPPVGWAVFPAGISGFLCRRPLRPLEVFFF
jgi:hypothetical protein